MGQRLHTKLPRQGQIGFVASLILATNAMAWLFGDVESVFTEKRTATIARSARSRRCTRNLQADTFTLVGGSSRHQEDYISNLLTDLAFDHNANVQTNYTSGVGRIDGDGRRSRYLGDVADCV